MNKIVCLNGEMLPPEKASVSVFDRGFLYGDSIYEVIRTYGGVPFELEAHLARLSSSAERIGMALPVPISVLSDETKRTHAACGHAESYLRIVVTRGSGEIGLDTALADNPLRLIIAQPLQLPSPETYERGVKIAIVSVRRNSKKAIDPLAKTGNYLNSVMALAEARRHGAYEAVMLDHRDLITECSSSNIFMSMGDLLLTPPLDVGILRGVTREVVLEIARKAGVRVLEGLISVQSLKQAEEVFITSSIREIIPVVQMDDDIVGTGKPGPMVKKIIAGFKEYVKAYNLRHRP